MKPFTVTLTDEAQADLDAVGDRRSYEAIENKLDELKIEPHRRGKSLGDTLEGFRSVRAAGQRYRILYRVMMLEQQTVVVVIGLRRAGSKRDVYKLAEKRLKGKGKKG